MWELCQEGAAPLAEPVWLQSLLQWSGRLQEFLPLEWKQAQPYPMAALRPGALAGSTRQQVNECLPALASRHISRCLNFQRFMDGCSGPGRAQHVLCGQGRVLGWANGPRHPQPGGERRSRTRFEQLRVGLRCSRPSGHFRGAGSARC